MHTRRLVVRHALVSLSFMLLYLVLNRPEVIFISQLGFTAWYPATGLVLGIMLGISPWYAHFALLNSAGAGIDDTGPDRCRAAGRRL